MIFKLITENCNFRLEESARIDPGFPYGPQWDIAFAVYRNDPEQTENRNGKNPVNLLEAVAHSRTDIDAFMTVDCILEKGSYTIVALSFKHFHSAGTFLIFIEIFYLVQIQIV